MLDFGQGFAIKMELNKKRYLNKKSTTCSVDGGLQGRFQEERI